MGQDPLVPNDAATASIHATLEIPDSTSSRLSPSGHIAPQDKGAKLAIIMIGLPARGKRKELHCQEGGSIFELVTA
jgi:hypothetical protein